MHGSVFVISKSGKYYMPRIKEMVKSIQIYPFTGMLDIPAIKMSRKSSKLTWGNMFYITLSKKSRRKHCNKQQDLKEKSTEEKKNT